MPRSAVLLLALASCATPPLSPRSDVDALVHAERAAVERFFGASFERDFEVAVFDDRADFEASMPPEWGVTPTQCWMVACGVGDGLRILDPRAWGKQACDHDGSDPEHVRGIVAHELVHVFHGQRNPSPDFSQVEGIDWFVEGLAVLASRQLETDRLAPASEAIATGAAPATLASAWQGRHRYAVCGTLVRELDRRCGRAKLVELLGARTNEELLALAGVSEPELLADWRARESAR
jgi:hypothetical protein